MARGTGKLSWRAGAVGGGPRCRAQLYRFRRWSTFALEFGCLRNPGDQPARFRAPWTYAFAAAAADRSGREKAGDYQLAVRRQKYLTINLKRLWTFPAFYVNYLLSGV